jgi:hypothetical protein
VHHGHSADFAGDYGLVSTINALLREGYGVLGVFMPHLRPGDTTGITTRCSSSRPQAAR